MRLRRALLIAVCLMPTAAATAVAQFQPPPQQQQQEPPCIKDFVKLRDDAAKKASAISNANKHKATAREACRLFNTFITAEAKMVKYAVDNAVWCGIPPNVIANMKQAHVKSGEFRARVCAVAAAPPRPVGPTLSDTLGAPITDAGNIKTGRGTFDTLTGNALGK